MGEKVKRILAAVLLVGGVAGYYILAGQPELWRVLAVLAGIVLAIVVAMQSEAGRHAWAFVKESRVELSKVVWPNRKETIQTTVVVIALVVATAVFLWIVDLGLIKGVSMLTGSS